MIFEKGGRVQTDLLGLMCNGVSIIGHSAVPQDWDDL